MVDMRRHQLVDMSNFATSPLEVARDDYQVSTVSQIASGDPYADLMAQFPQLSKPNFSQHLTAHGVKYYIKTEGPPLHSRARRLAPDRLLVAKEEFRKMEDMGIIRRSNSPWASPLHMVQKQSGG